MTSTTVASPPQTGRRKLRVILSSGVGTFVEWYDFYIYGTAAGLVFPTVFFPQIDPVAGTIASLGTLTIGYISRPLGAIVYGHFGDRIGRKRMLVTSLLLMGIATFLVGLLPGYATIGIAAPIILIVLRFLQGFAAGGEWGGAALMAMEHAPTGRRGLWSSSVQSASFLGTAASAATFALVSQMPQEDFLSWGWRIPFLASAVLVGAGLWVRLKVEESPVFKEFQAQQAKEEKVAVPFATVFRRDWRSIIRAILLVVGPFALSTVFVAVAPRFLVDMGVEPGDATAALTIGLLVPIAGAWIAGWLSDTFGRKPIYLIGCVLSVFAAWAALQLFTTGIEGYLVLGFVIVYIAHSFAYGNIPVFVSEQFPTGTRFTGASLAYHVAGVLGGGIMPVAGYALITASGGAPNYLYLLLLIAGLFVVTAIAVLTAKETSRKDLLELEPEK